MNKKVFLILGIGILLIGSFFTFGINNNHKKINLEYDEKISFNELVEGLSDNYIVKNFGKETLQDRKEFFNKINKELNR